ncbi:hypothetical protein [Bartonella sp. HY761]|uniref:hypothetical protein n=1 Tax=Bartonella sp. HY761 TaxID=2979330 RepID=UPI0022037420|nr:hypothetical protein [Bartonella sp. HY761]UXN06283.1 hypothetical protein N6A79_13600 [Bartonella sp. HY761]
MTEMTSEQTVIEIGKILFRCAGEYASEELGNFNNWDYAGAIFEEGGGAAFLYKNRVLYSYGFRDYQLEISNLWRQFRALTQVEGDKPWLKCKAVIRNDGSLQMLFEFDDEDKWSIGPRNIDQMYEIMLGDIFPEALEIQA